MTNLVKIKKHGEPDLKILPHALDQHKKLGWHVAEQQDEEEIDDEGDGTGEAVVDASKAAKELADANGIDLKAVTGTSEGGKINKADVQKAIDERAAAQKVE